MPWFKTWAFFMNRPCISTLQKCKQFDIRCKRALNRTTQSDSAYMSISAFISASRLTSSVGCHKPISKCFARKGHTALSRTWKRKNLLIYVNNDNNDNNWNNAKLQTEVPQFRSRWLGPVLAGFLGRKKIYRHAILRVNWNIPVQYTQIGHSVVNISIVEHFQRTHLACIHRRRNIVFPHSLLLVGRNIERTKTFKLTRKTINKRNK